MTKPVIQTPRGKISIMKNGKASLTWNTGFEKKWQDRYSNAQMYVDSEVLRLSEPYIPLLSSMLIKSGILGTEIGSGTVQWIAVYAKSQYYSPRTPGSLNGPLRGPHWFTRMIAVNRKKIVDGTKRVIGKGEKSPLQKVQMKNAQRAIEGFRSQTKDEAYGK